MSLPPRWIKRPANLSELPDGYVLTTSGGDVTFAQTTGGPAAGVSAFNGRIGNVYPAEGDYNASLVGAEPANVNIQGHIISLHAPANAQKNSDITKAEIEAKLTGAITSHSHTGGSDPWQIVRLAGDFTTSLATNANVTNFYFTPAINKTYLIQGYFLLRTATATVGPRPGLAWASNLTDSACQITVPNSNTAWAFRSQGARTTQNAASTGLPTTADSYLARLEAFIITSGTTSGNMQITLASETAGTNVTMRAGSILMYREI